MMLGRYLARNLAGEQNTQQARFWLEQARKQGVAEVEADLAALSAYEASQAQAASAAD